MVNIWKLLYYTRNISGGLHSSELATQQESDNLFFFFLKSEESFNCAIWAQTAVPKMVGLGFLFCLFFKSGIKLSSFLQVLIFQISWKHMGGKHWLVNRTFIRKCCPAALSTYLQFLATYLNKIRLACQFTQTRPLNIAENEWFFFDVSWPTVLFIDKLQCHAIMLKNDKVKHAIQKMLLYCS